MKRLAERAMNRAIVLAGMLLTVVAGERATHGADADIPARTVGRVAAKQLDEVSGVAVSRRQPDVLWMHNDGDAKYVYAVRPSGQTVARVKVPGKTDDVEDIAIGPGPRRGIDYLYLGDVGDNDERRREIRLLRFAEPSVSLPGVRAAATDVEEIRLTYPDGPHNAETLLVDPVTGDVLIVTKEKRRGRVYVASAASLTADAPVTLQRLGDVDCQYVSGGDISPSGDVIVLRRESQGWLWRRPDGTSVGDALRAAPQEIPVRCRGQALNGEAIALVADGSGYYTISEGEHEPICLFSLAGRPTVLRAKD